MDFGIFSDFWDTLDGLGDLISLLGDFFEGFPKFFSNMWSWFIIIIIIAGIFSIIWHSLS